MQKGRSFEYLLKKINETPGLEKKNIEIINCSCHQSQKFLFEEIQNHLDEMSKYFSHGIAHNTPLHIILSKDIDKKIEELEKNGNKKELFNTLRSGETFKQILLKAMICGNKNNIRIEQTIQNAENLNDLFYKIFPATNVTLQIDSSPNNIVNSYVTNKDQINIIVNNLSDLLGAGLSKDEIIRQNADKRILLHLDKNIISKMFKDFNEFFKDVVKNENHEYGDLHEKCKGKKGEELFNVVFEAFTDEKRKKIIKEKNISNEDIKEAEDFFYQISQTAQEKLNKEMDEAFKKDITNINDKIKKIMDEHNRLVEQLTKEIVNNPDKIDENQFVEKKKEILELKNTIIEKIDHNY